MDQSTFLLEEHPARASALQDFGEALLMTEATSHLSFYAWLNEHGPAGCCGRMSPVSCQSTEAGPLAPSSEGWRNSGMGSHTGFWTLNSSEFHSGAVACSLSDILETGDLPQRYFLSAKACAGILRRAGKRGRALPPSLQMALEHAAQTTTKGKQAT
jgi:hypothetical protein